MWKEVEKKRKRIIFAFSRATAFIDYFFPACSCDNRMEINNNYSSKIRLLNNFFSKHFYSSEKKRVSVITIILDVLLYLTSPHYSKRCLWIFNVNDYFKWMVKYPQCFFRYFAIRRKIINNVFYFIFESKRWIFFFHDPV